MLTLGVSAGDYITIGSDIVVQVVRVGEQFRLAIDAPRTMKITRAKLHEEQDDIPACIRRVRALQQPPKKYDFKQKR